MFTTSQMPNEMRVSINYKNKAILKFYNNYSCENGLYDEEELICNLPDSSYSNTTYIDKNMGRDYILNIKIANKNYKVRTLKRLIQLLKQDSAIYNAIHNTLMINEIKPKESAIKEIMEIIAEYKYNDSYVCIN